MVVQLLGHNMDVEFFFMGPKNLDIMLNTSKHPESGVILMVEPHLMIVGMMRLFTENPSKRMDDHLCAEFKPSSLKPYSTQHPLDGWGSNCNRVQPIKNTAGLQPEPRHLLWTG